MFPVIITRQLMPVHIILKYVFPFVHPLLEAYELEITFFRLVLVRVMNRRVVLLNGASAEFAANSNFCVVA